MSIKICSTDLSKFVFDYSQIIGVVGLEFVISDRFVRTIIEWSMLLRISMLRDIWVSRSQRLLLRSSKFSVEIDSKEANCYTTCFKDVFEASFAKF